MIHIICVKWGNKYGSDYVNKLYKGIVNNTTIPFTFTCYTDDNSNIQKLSAPLPISNLIGWWNKIFMFDSKLHLENIKDIKVNDRMFFIDLDSIITGNIDDILLSNEKFIVLSDPYRYNTKHIGSGIMSWNYEEHDYLFKNFRQQGVGDQVYIGHNLRVIPARWQTLFPGQIISYKVENFKKQTIPNNTRIIYFHGTPNPHEVTHLDWVRKYWNDL